MFVYAVYNKYTWELVGVASHEVMAQDLINLASKILEHEHDDGETLDEKARWFAIEAVALDEIGNSWLERNAS